jgi:hypothetical protein
MSNIYHLILEFHGRVAFAVFAVATLIFLTNFPCSAFCSDTKSYDNKVDRGNSPPLPTIKMSKQEYQTFLKKREAAKESLIPKETRHPDWEIHDEFTYTLDGKHFTIEASQQTPLSPVLEVVAGQKRIPFHGLEIVGTAKSDLVSKLTKLGDNFPDAKRLILHTNGLSSDKPLLSDDVIDCVLSLKNLRELVLEDEFITCRMSEDQVRRLAKHPSLRHIAFGPCEISDREFQHLAELKTLVSVSVNGTITPHIFLTLAKLPHIARLEVNGSGFLNPIDAETRQAIQSLDGRLKYFGGYESTEELSVSYPAINVSVIRALAKLKSIKYIHAGAFVHEVTLPDMEDLNQHADISMRLGVLNFKQDVPQIDRKKAQAISDAMSKRSKDFFDRTRAHQPAPRVIKKSPDAVNAPQVTSV